MTDLERLAALPWFAQMAPQVREALISRGRWLHRESGKWLYGEGDEDTGVVAVVKGGLYLYATAPGKRDLLFAVVPSGQIIGQSHLFGGGPRLVTAICSTDSLLFKLTDRVLRQTVEAYPSLQLSLAALTYEQMRFMLQMIANYAALKPRERLIAWLEILSGVNPHIPASQSALAEMLGVSRKAVNGWLAEIERAGHIVRGYGFIKVINRAGLQRMLA